MKIAIISDIHGNYQGLIEALADIKSAACDEIICLGDLVDGGEYNEAVIDELRKLNIKIVRGNHDESNDLRLDKELQTYLLALPEQIEYHDALYTHISPRKNKRKIDSAIEAWNVFDETDYKIIFTGHIHYPLIFGKNNDEPFYACRYQFDYNQPCYLDSDDRYIICVGSLGYGRDQVGKLRYCVYDELNYSIEMRAIEGTLLPFDWKLRAER